MDRAPGPEGRRIAGVSSARKVLQVLLSFSEQRPHLTIQQIADAAGVPVSTAYRYVSLLRELSLVEEGDNVTYHVTHRIVSVARAAASASNLVKVARPLLEELATQVHETIMLLRMIQHSAVLIDRVESTLPVRLSYEPGQPLPLYAGASGKTLLAFMPPRRRETYLQTTARSNPSVAARLPALRKELDEIAERGWAVSHGEIDDGIWAISYAIRSPERLHGTLSVAGPQYRIPGEEQRRIARLLEAAAAELSARMSSHDLH
jgi:DNA-binding IclR family transcriptional regulator